MQPWIENSLLAAIEAVSTALPRRRPAATALAAARIISHRGEREKRGALENTFAAFDPLVDSGVWGIEFDLRWTRDAEPVVCHDADLRRVFGQPLEIAATDFAELRRACPALPHLDEMVARYGKALHLMIELKTEAYPQREIQRRRLQQALAGLTPAVDFHMLTLATEMFAHIPELPPACRVPVARLNTAAVGDYARAHRCGGIAAPCFALSARRIASMRRLGQNVGVGFPAHRNLLFREIGRGVNWIFSNHALRLQRLLDAARGAAAPAPANNS